MEVYEIASGIGVRAVVGSDWALAQNPAQHNLQQQQREQEDASRVSSTARCLRGAATADVSPPRPGRVDQDLGSGGQPTNGQGVSPLGRCRRDRGALCSRLATWDAVKSGDG